MNGEKVDVRSIITEFLETGVIYTPWEDGAEAIKALLEERDRYKAALEVIREHCELPNPAPHTTNIRDYAERVLKGET